MFSHNHPRRSRNAADVDIRTIFQTIWGHRAAITCASRPPKRMTDHVRRRKFQNLYQEPDII